LGFLIGLWFSSAFSAVFISIFLGFVIPIILLGGCLGVIPAVITIVALLQDASEWYYHQRLLCIEDRDNCVVGSVLVEPEVSTDGDRKLNLLLAPFTEAECFELLCRHLNDNEQLLNSPAPFIDNPFFGGTPPVQFVPFNADILDDPMATPDERRAERKKVEEYLRAIRGHDEEDDDATSKAYNNMLIGWMDRLLDPSNVFPKTGQPKNFQGRYYRKDPNVIPPGTPLSDAIPPDFDPTTAWQSPNGSLSPLTQDNPYEDSFQPRPLNAMFRFDHSREEPEKPDRLLPYLHCELDGNWVQLFLDELSLAITSFGVAYFFLCIALPWPLSLLAGPIAALLALLIFLLQRWLDGGENRGQADPPDVTFDDPDNFGADGDQLDGDLVTILGPWIMDTEHTQYFEIHPVKAYYILGRNGRGAIEIFDSAAALVNHNADRLHNGVVGPTMLAEICGLAQQAEGEDPPPVITRDAPTLLSHGLRTHWGGGGFGAVVR
jgi:hypothetical protein